MSALPNGDLFTLTESGLFCPAGGFHVDPWRPVERAVITHGHSDHARPGSKRYLTTPAGEHVLRLRLGADAVIETLPYGEQKRVGDVTVSLHPAGHLLGSAQVRLEAGGHVTVISGDYKRQPDATCAPFEVVPCDTFVTESTFGLPVYRWPDPQRVFDEINGWWRENARQQLTTLICGYALGKAQRILTGVDTSIGPIIVHGAIANLLPAYEAAGVRLPSVLRYEPAVVRANRGQALVVAPPGAMEGAWLRKLGEYRAGFASGWMQLRGPRRRQSLDRGFVLSDHVDWPALLQTIEETGARRVYVTHGYTSPVVRYLRERGVDAHELRTRFTGDAEEPADGSAEVPDEGPAED